MRGQAALEFLTTYGWAILVVLVMIGALAYFGVINPTRFLPEKCIFQQEVTCKDFMIDNQGRGSRAVHFYITNNIGETMTNLEFAAEFEDKSRSQQCLASVGGPAIAPIAPGESGQVVCDAFTTVPNVVVGERAKVKIYGNYTKSSGAYAHPLYGEMLATVSS